MNPTNKTSLFNAPIVFSQDYLSNKKPLTRALIAIGSMADSYTYLGKKKVEAFTSKELPIKDHAKKTALKVTSYVLTALILPALALIAKAIYVNWATKQIAKEKEAAEQEIAKLKELTKQLPENGFEVKQEGTKEDVAVQPAEIKELTEAERTEANNDIARHLEELSKLNALPAEKRDDKQMLKLLCELQILEKLLGNVKLDESSNSLMLEMSKEPFLSLEEYTELKKRKEKEAEANKDSINEQIKEKQTKIQKVKENLENETDSKERSRLKKEKDDLDAEVDKLISKRDVLIYRPKPKKRKNLKLPFLSISISDFTEKLMNRIFERNIDTFEAILPEGISADQKQILTEKFNKIKENPPAKRMLTKTNSGTVSEIGKLIKLGKNFWNVVPMYSASFKAKKREFEFSEEEDLIPKDVEANENLPWMTNYEAPINET